MLYAVLLSTRAAAVLARSRVWGGVGIAGALRASTGTLDPGVGPG